MGEVSPQYIKLHIHFFKIFVEKLRNFMYICYKLVAVQILWTKYFHIHYYSIILPQKMIKSLVEYTKYVWF